MIEATVKDLLTRNYPEAEVDRSLAARYAPLLQFDALYVHPAWERRAAEPHRLLTPEWISLARRTAV
jgi:hypothetical protein